MTTTREHRWFGAIEEVQFPSTCFVMMPFKPAWANDVWRAIHTSLALEGLNCIRADSMRGRIIMRDIIEGIAKSQFLLADVSDGNPNVFYEVGICHAWELDVLLVTQNPSSIPFDTAHFRHVPYKLSPDGLSILQRELRNFAREKIQSKFEPSKIPIDHANSLASSEGRKLLGQWEGLWSGTVPGSLPHTLVVSKVDGSKVSLVYFSGNSAEWRVQAGFRRTFGELHGNVLRVEWPETSITYTLSDDTLVGVRTDPLGTFVCEMTKTREA